jgi:glycogen debranching enzyme
MAGDEEPGEVFHENRHPLDKIGIDLTRERGWSWPYYGAVDTTPNFILDVIDYRALQAEGEKDILSEQVVRKDGRQVEVRESVLAAAEWILRRMDSNKEGLIEFKRTLPTGIENQVFKDSRDSYSRKDGSLANHEQGVASIEVQVAAYNAFKGLEEMFPENKEEYANRAEKLRTAIFEYFWTETADGEGYFIIGTDRNDNGNLRQLDTLTSNAASVLDSALLEGDEEEVVRKRNLLIRSLFSEKMWSSGGIRTLASDEVRYEADAYHNGSVWPHDNAEIARGLDRHGYHGLAGKVWEKIIEVSVETHLYPEKVSGDNGIKPHLNHWIVDVETPEGKTLRVIQPGQLLQGFDLAAYIEAKERMEQVSQGAIPGVASGDKAVLEDQVLKAVSALEAIRRNNILLMPQSGEVFRGETFAAD